MLTALDTRETIEFVSQFDKSENPTKFIIGVLDNMQKIALMKGYSAVLKQDASGAVSADVNGVPIDQSAEQSIAVLLAGLKEIRGIAIPGKGVQNITEITREVVGVLPLEVLFEVANKVAQVNFPAKDEVKN